MLQLLFAPLLLFRQTQDVNINNSCDLQWATNFVDHFGHTEPPLNRTKFKQRVFICGMDEWTPGSPIFFYTGNEANVELYINNTGLMWENQKKFNALLIFMEHRYFGESQPYGDVSDLFQQKYLNYLSSEQALADYATFLKQFLDSNGRSPVFTFGGSYGGMLAAWMRLKYPELITGAISASAPVLYFYGMHPKVDINGFNRVVTFDATPAGGSADRCADNVHSTWDVIADYAKSSSGRQKLETTLKLCNPLKDEDDALSLRDWLSEAWAYMAMGSFPYTSSYMLNGKASLPPYPLRVACVTMGSASSAEDSLLDAMRRSAGLYFNATGSNECFDIHQIGNNETTLVGELWGYLACTEMVMPQGSDGKNDMFWDNKFDLEAYKEMCQEAYGVTPREDWVATNYGDFRGSSNIVFTNGALDPWKAGGVLSNLSDTTFSLIIDNVGHHVDLFYSHEEDPISVIKARKFQVENLERWQMQWEREERRTQILTSLQELKYVKDKTQSAIDELSSETCCEIGCPCRADKDCCSSYFCFVGLLDVRKRELDIYL